MKRSREEATSGDSQLLDLASTAADGSQLLERPQVSTAANGLQQWSDSVRVEKEFPSATEAAMAVWPDRFPSASAAKKAVRRKTIMVNGEVAKTGGGPTVVAKDSMMQIKERRAQKGTEADATASMALQIVYRDLGCAVCFKPAGIPVDQQRDKDNSVMRSMLHQLPDTPVEEALRRPAPVHRLDLETAGLVMVARTHSAARCLSEALQEHTAKKRYRAVVVGRMDSNSGEVSLALSHQECKSSWELVENLEFPLKDSDTTVSLSLLDLWPQTGR